MIIRLTLKDPDGVSNSIDDIARNSVESSIVENQEIEDLIEHQKDKIEDAIKPWVRYNEYVTIEIDTEKNTATVCRT